MTAANGKTQGTGQSTPNKNQKHRNAQGEREKGGKIKGQVWQSGIILVHRKKASEAEDTSQ